ncbi:cyanophycinase [Galbibacter mesophilus]|uniref:cyanophycinase n=1 Tax=Galbibacter mesophilus TaxID=379069 RepID=UPI00191F3761|nr:cyanophycinase [Galbibacter mesophilus]MCM5661437.1 cyanophycinase [Galbibacter mesophilus]
MKLSKWFRVLLLCFVFFSCESKKADLNETLADEKLKVENTAKGKLFIIGGGKRPPELIRKLLTVSDFTSEDYLVILPMSSSEPDSAVYYASKQFLELGISEEKIKGYNFQKENNNPNWIDSLEQAKLIYISGGDQTKFMDVTLNTPIQKAIKSAYEKGGIIAGTSAGAAVMSKKMITGDEFKHPEYTGDFKTIEADNIEIVEGLGLLENAIIDQHFIQRMRMNRLLSVALEHPRETAIGIDESTAIIVEGDSATVAGKSQVIVVKNKATKIQKQNGLLGGDSLQTQVVLPGKKFSLRNH